MRLAVLILNLLLGTCHLGYAQNSLAQIDKSEKKNFNSIRKNLNRITNSQSADVSRVAQYIKDITYSDLDKAYAAYYWVSRNITYDMKSVQANRTISYKPEEVIKTKTAVCTGYSYLFNAICTELGLTAKVISGYSRGYGYREGDSFNVSNHSWNLLLIGDKWYPVDATWASPNTNLSSVKSSPGATYYFMDNPKDFIVSHLPENPKHQLIAPVITIQTFEAGTSEVLQHSQFAVVVNKNDDNYLKYEDVAAHEVAMKELALNFNPKNKNALYKLGVAVLYQALDTMETMHLLNYDNVLTELPKYKFRIYELLDEAAFHFKGVPPSSGGEIYKSAQTFLSETTYQKGVFNYEAAQIIFDKTAKLAREDVLPVMDKINTAISQYYDIAIDYFNRIDRDSWYYDNAQHYIYMIKSERDEAMVK